MTVLRTETDCDSLVTISGNAELRDAAGLKQALIESLDKGRALTIDLSGVERVDTALLQMIFSAVRTFGKAGTPLSLLDSGDSSPFRTGLQTAGFAAVDPPIPAKKAK